MAQTGKALDPYLGCDFIVELQNIVQGQFQEVSGLDSTIDVAEYREGGDNETMRKLPGKTKYSNVVMKRGIYSAEIFDWNHQWVTGDPSAKRINISVILRDRTGQEVMRWNLRNAWPVKWTGPSLNAKGNDIAIETLELAHEGIVKG